MSTWLYLNHVLSETTPLYGGKGGVRIARVRSIVKGDTSNESELVLQAHSGTHMDAPRHFDAAGATLDSYAPDFWHATRPCLIEAPCEPGTVLDRSGLGTALDAVPKDCDLLLLRTGAERWRSAQPAVYAKQGPGVAPDVAHWLRRNRKLKFLGMDFISVSSFAHREIGRESHRAFLSPHESGNPPILLVEDMALARLVRAPQLVWVVPLCYTEADGAPVTVLATV